VTKTDAQELRELGEWDWWVLPTWNRLHAAEEFNYDQWPVGDGRTACGRRGRLALPGILTRMGAHRCDHCCDRLGFPRGIGSPKNDKACRPLAEQRIAALVW
jgi:hypothetical protein